jgi:uncharacterized protein (DUF302 family)
MTEPEQHVEDSGMVTKLSRLSVVDTVSRLTDLIESKGIRMFAVIDQRLEAQHVGLDLRETVLVIFGDPLQGTPVMEAEPLAALDLPLKVLVWNDGGQTKVTYLSPDALAARHHLEPEVAANLTGINPLTDALVQG